MGSKSSSKVKILVCRECGQKYLETLYKDDEGLCQVCQDKNEPGPSGDTVA